METENEILIGLEIHIELDNKSKLFCGCSTGGAIEPNTLTCPVCLGHPGSKPVLNKAVVDHALKLALALNCNISPELIFSRKIYFYPDMAKNFQITQYEIPLGSKGYLQLSNKKVGITRVHIEEDPASLVHPVGMQQSSYVLVDYNRSGHPLCEVVTEPQMYSAEEAREFMKRLLTTLKYLKIFDPDRCVIKADANVNIVGCERVEIKNITGFKEIEKAILYEVSRQEKLKKEGKLIKTRETRGWDSENGVTIFQRRKETEEDYGYIIEPDLAKIDITDDMVKKTKAALPELPDKKSLRYQKELKLKREDADAIANSYDLANLYESVIKYIDPIFAAEWIRREVVRVLNYNKKELNESFINKNLISVLGLIKNIISLLQFSPRTATKASGDNSTSCQCCHMLQLRVHRWV